MGALLFKVGVIFQHMAVKILGTIFWQRYTFKGKSDFPTRITDVAIKFSV